MVEDRREASPAMQGVLPEAIVRRSLKSQGTRFGRPTPQYPGDLVLISEDPFHSLPTPKRWRFSNVVEKAEVTPCISNQESRVKVS